MLILSGLIGPALSNGASAEPRRTARALVALSYQAPGDCPDSSSVLRRVAALVRQAPAAPIAAQAMITHRDGYQLELDVEGGHRRITSESCQSLVETLAVILALAVDPSARIPSPAPVNQGNSPNATTTPGDSAPDPAAVPHDESTPAAAAQPPEPMATAQTGDRAAVEEQNRPIAPNAAVPNGIAAVPTTSTNATHTAPRAERNRAANETGTVPHRMSPASRSVITSNRHNQPADGNPSAGTVPAWPTRWSGASLLWIEQGMLPRLAVGANLGARLDVGAWSVGAFAFGLLPQWAQMSGVSEHRGGTISFVGGQISGCREILTGTLLLGCLGIEVGDLMGKGGDGGSGRLGHGLWLAPTSGIALRPAISSIFDGELRLELALPLNPLSYGIDGNNWRFEPNSVSLRLGTGICWHG